MSKHSISRRKFLRVTGLAAGIGALSAESPRGKLAAEAPKGKPNIIFIMADDLGYADLGCYGQKLIRTPSIDAMAHEATRFTNCYTGASVCAPSRCVLMTGLHTGHSTVRGNKGINAPKHDGQDGRIPLKATDVTVATVLKQAGYSTGITGKWGLGEPGSTGLPNDHGFDEWLGYLNQDHAPFYYTDYLWRNREKWALEGNQGGRREQYSHDLLTEFALEFVRKHRDGPFFLYVPYCIPHQNLEVPSLEPYQNQNWEDDAKVFAAMVTRMDRDVGRILGLLKELGIDDKTIVFFCSDNGSAQGWKGVFDSCGPLRDKKSAVYEGGIRTPMIVRWPGRVEEGKVDDTPWYFADVLPTFADLAGVTPAQKVDGVSVAKTLLGEGQDLTKRYLYWEQVKGKGVLQQAVRRANWKAVRLDPGSPLELYDLSRDVGEEHNVAAGNPEIVKEFESYLKDVRTESAHWPTR